jgi:O-antigen/teichoic acid export membrane protein
MNSDRIEPNSPPAPSEVSQPQPSLSRRVFGNLVANQAGFFFPLVIGFVIAPFIVRNLGDRLYGVWSLIVAFTGHYGLFAGGIQSATTRYLAYAIGHEDPKMETRYVNAALSILLPAAALCALGGVLVAVFGADKFNIPPDLLNLARHTIVIASMAVGATFAFAVFSCLLVANQRFDTMNGIAVGGLFLRAGLIVILFKAGFGILALAYLTLGIAVFTGVLYYFAARRQEPHWKLDLRKADRASLRALFTFGGKSLMGIGADLLMTQADLVLIGIYFPPERITVYALASTMLRYTGSFVSSIVRVADPYTAQSFARSGTRGVRTVFLEGSSFMYAMGGIIAAGGIILGQAFFRLWIGPEYGECGVLMAILIFPQIFNPNSRLGYSVLTGTARIGTYNTMRVGSGLLKVVLSLVLMRYYEIYGVAIATLVAYLLVDLIWFPSYMGRVLNYEVRQLYLKALGPGLIVFFATLGSGWGAIHLLHPGSWHLLLVDSVLTAAGGILTAWLVLPREVVGVDWRLRIRQVVRSRVRDLLARVGG